MCFMQYYRGPFMNNNAFRLYHNHRLDPATKGRHIRRLPDRTLVWSDEYEQRLREYESKKSSADSDQIRLAPIKGEFGSGNTKP